MTRHLPLLDLRAIRPRFCEVVLVEVAGAAVAAEDAAGATGVESDVAVGTEQRMPPFR